MEHKSSNQEGSSSAGKNTKVFLVPCCPWRVFSAISSGLDIPKVAGCHFVQQISSQCGSQKLIPGSCLINSQPAFLIYTSFWCNQMAVLSKKCANQITLNHTSLWNFALPIFEVFVLILLHVILSLNKTALIFLLSVRQAWKTQLILDFFCYRLSSFNSKELRYSYRWSCS